MEAEIVYHIAKHSNVETLTELLCELYETQAPNISYEELLAENIKALQDGKQIFFIAYDGRMPVGVCHGALREEYVNGKEFDGTCGYLEAVYVRPTHRLRGIAAKFVALCEDWARQKGCREFLSDCLLHNEESFRFHLRMGFVETERCIFFRKELSL